jgi:hypothetical protein
MNMEQSLAEAGWRQACCVSRVYYAKMTSTVKKETPYDASLKSGPSHDHHRRRHRR